MLICVYHEVADGGESLADGGEYRLLMLLKIGSYVVATEKWKTHFGER